MKISGCAAVCTVQHRSFLIFLTPGIKDKETGVVGIIKREAIRWISLVVREPYAVVCV
jgi:hypothetical protein